MTIRVNWNQGKTGLIRAHDVSNQKPNCKFQVMKDFEDFDEESSAEAAIRKAGYSRYKRCALCWDDRVRFV